MRVKPRKFVIATMLTALTRVASIGARTDSTTVTQCASGANPVWIQNAGTDTDGVDDYVFPPAPGSNRYTQENTGAPLEFCPTYAATYGGVEYYYYFDWNPDNNLCLTANGTTDEAYAATCTEYPASQEWHYYGKGNQLVNYYTGDCLWFAGQPPEPGDLVNVGGPDCKDNQNDELAEVSAG